MRSVRLAAAFVAVAAASGRASVPLPPGNPPTPGLVRGAFLRAFRVHDFEDASRVIEAGVAALPEVERAALDLDRRLLENARQTLASLPALVPAGEKFPAALGRGLRARGDVVAS